MVTISAELPKLSQNKTGHPFFGPPCISLHLWTLLSCVYGLCYYYFIALFALHCYSAIRLFLHCKCTK